MKINGYNYIKIDDSFVQQVMDPPEDVFNKNLHLLSGEDVSILRDVMQAAKFWYLMDKDTLKGLKDRIGYMRGDTYVWTVYATLHYLEKEDGGLYVGDNEYKTWFSHIVR